MIFYSMLWFDILYGMICICVVGICLFLSIINFLYVVGLFFSIINFLCVVGICLFLSIINFLYVVGLFFSIINFLCVVGICLFVNYKFPLCCRNIFFNYKFSLCCWNLSFCQL